MTPWSRNDFRYAKQNWELNFMTKSPSTQGQKDKNLLLFLNNLSTSYSLQFNQKSAL